MVYDAFLVCGDLKTAHYIFGDAFWHFMFLTCYDLLHFAPVVVSCMNIAMRVCFSGSQKSSQINNWTWNIARVWWGDCEIFNTKNNRYFSTGTVSGHGVSVPCKDMLSFKWSKIGQDVYYLKFFHLAQRVNRAKIL